MGGHCIAVDPWFIVDAAPEQARLIRTAREVNDAKPGLGPRQGRCGRPRRVRGRPVVAASGWRSRPNIDDLRESPARGIVGSLADELPGATILAVEPHIDDLPTELAALPNVVLASFEDAVEDADVVVLLVDHSAFGSADHQALRRRGAVVVDTRGVWR